MSQRDVAHALGVGLGKVNYCVRALVRNGWVKVANFKNSRNKVGYMYLLTPRGIEKKGKLALQFLHRKVREYELLRGKVRRLRQEVLDRG